MRPKIGAVSYLNTKPLVQGMEQSAKEFELVFDLPSRLADRLSQGDLDVALIPVIEAVANPEYTIVSDACIACEGPVWSVKLMSKVDGPDIKTLALDEGSRTSRALTKVLLDQKYSVRPELVSLPINQDWRTVETDAVLIIGDRAMNAEAPDFPFSWDLGETWNQLTGKPFVFAVWAARPGADLERLTEVLSNARDAGLSKVKEIADAQASLYGLTEEECLKYLTDYLHFRLGEAEKSGMNLFFQLADQLALIPEAGRADPTSDELPNEQIASGTVSSSVQLNSVSESTNPQYPRLRYYDCQTNSPTA